MQCKRTFTKRFNLSSQKEIAPFYSNSNKKFASLAAIARYIAIRYNIDYICRFSAGYFFTKKKIAMVFKKTIIMYLFHLARLASIT